MRKGTVVGSLAVAGVFAATVAAALVPQRAFAAEKSQANPFSMPANYRSMVGKYCAGCHNDTDNIPAARPLYLDEANFDDISKDPATWEMVIHKLGIGEMPPQGKPHPDASQLHGFAQWLTGAMDTAANRANDPGDFVAHRLNRTEYANAIRDLFGVQSDVADLLPPDSADFGFDNIATALQTSPALLDRYIAAAEHVSDAVIGDAKAEPQAVIFPIRRDVNQIGHVAGLPLGTRGGQLVQYDFPADGQYDLSAALIRPVDSSDSGIEGQDAPNEFIILVDGVPVKSAWIGGPEDHKASINNMSAARDAVAARMRVRTFIKAGPHSVAFTFVDRPARDQDIYQISQRGSEDIHVGNGRPALNTATIKGPFDVTGVSQDPYRARLYICQPGQSSSSQRACAHKILATLARRAYRRPVTETDLNFVMPFYEQARTQGGDFDAGIRAALPRILVSPDFLFRTEEDPDSLAPGAVHPVSDLDLASRLSFFLWSSIPDDQLMTLAAANRLHKPAVLAQQVRRMLADDRAQAFTTNFPDQWLELRNLPSVAPDLLGFPDWDKTLRDGLQTETELFFDSIARHNQSALDLLNANYTFLNQRVAQHYGIPGVYGTAFRRVTVTDPHRRGLLGQGSILAVTALGPTPIFRGKWVLTALLDDPPLPPPPNVPQLPSEAGAKTMRQRLDVHTKVEPCASCHNLMDPIGFALEGFGPTGQWRTSDAGLPIDSSGVLLDGSTVNGPQQLDDWFTNKHPDVFVGTLTKNLLIYALGRGLQPYDMEVVRDIVRRAAKDHYKFDDLILGVVESRPFLMRKKLSAPPGDQRTAGVQTTSLQE